MTAKRRPRNFLRRSETEFRGRRSQTEFGNEENRGKTSGTYEGRAMIRAIYASIGFLMLLAALPAARCAEAEWKVGLAQVKITPERPVFLAGYASRNKPFTKVEADLYAKALAFEDGQGHRVVLVTSDLIGFPAAVAEPICERLRQRIGLM